MAKTRKLKFLAARGYGAIRIATGATADVPEPWASRFIADGTAVEVENKPEAKAAKPKASAKKKDK
jgi:hypothetical protein